MSTNSQEKEIEKVIEDYYNDLFDITAYNDQINYYKINKDKIKINVSEEIDAIECKIAEKKFKIKHTDEVIDNMDDEMKIFLELKYKRKLSVTEIQLKMFMKDRTYYRMRKKVLSYLYLHLQNYTHENLIEKQIC